MWVWERKLYKSYTKMIVQISFLLGSVWLWEESEKREIGKRECEKREIDEK